MASLILGKGGFGIQLSELLQASLPYPELLFLDDNAPDCAGKLRDFVDPQLMKRCPDAYVALGNSTLRVELLQKLDKLGYNTPVFFHEHSCTSPSALLGAGTLVLPFAYVGAGVKTGLGCIINTGAIVDHNATLGDGVHLSPGAIVKAGATVPDFTKVESGEVVRSPWDK